MSSFSRGIALWVVSLAACLPASAQGALSQILESPAPASGSAKTSSDALGRDTPYGTVFGFLQAAQAGNYSIAAQYLQMSASRRQAEGETVAQDLKEVMDRSYSGSLKNLSMQPEGVPQEGVPPGRQKIRNHVVRRRGSRAGTGTGSDPSAGKDLADLFRHFDQSPGTLRPGRSPAGGNAFAQVDGEASVRGHAVVAMVRHCS
jgi:hypothetical protein